MEAYTGGSEELLYWVVTNLVRRISQFLPLHTRKSLYNALVLLHIDYCCVVWHDCAATLAQGIERIQSYGMRVITSAELREKLQWTTLTDRRVTST